MSGYCTARVGCCVSAAQHGDLSVTVSERVEWHLNKLPLLAIMGSCLRI